VCQCDGELGLSVDISHGLAHVNENVTLTCRVTGALDPAMNLKWTKTVKVNGNEDLVATNDQLSPLYSTLADTKDRYEVIVVSLTDVTLYILTIYRTYHSGTAAQKHLKWCLRMDSFRDISTIPSMGVGEGYLPTCL
jgi:hypothetical protein